MKARWNDQDCAQIVRKPLPFAEVMVFATLKWS
jgi:hypothetical protein